MTFLGRYQSIPIPINHLAFEDPESCFAAGGVVPLIDSELFELELISGISETTAINLLEKREAIIDRATQLPFDKRHQAFELAKGIGPKKAELLGKRFSRRESTKTTGARCLLQEHAQ